MSITDELREFARGCAGGMGGDALCHIADRIDAEHERLMAGRRRSCVFYDAERNYCKVHDEGDMADFGWMRLPKGADGEYIHIGDVMEWIDLEGKVSATCTAEAVGVDAFIAWDKANGRYAQKCATAYRHYHAPTVEDVLRQFAREIDADAYGITDAKVAEFAAKLRLAGDE